MLTTLPRQIHYRSLFPSLPILLIGMMLFGAGKPCSAEGVEGIRINDDSGFADATIVRDKALVHSGLILPVNENGVVSAAAVDDQMAQLEKNLGKILDAEKDKSEIVSIRVHLATEEDLHYVKEKVQGSHANIVTLVVSPLPLPNAKAGMEVVYATETTYDKVTSLESPVPGLRLTVLPRGRALYISGQLEKGDGTIETAKKTMDGLHKTLDHVGLDASHVVSIRTFLDPMSKSAEVDEVINSYYSEEALPSVTHLEWKTPDNIEIEMIAWVPSDLEVEGADPEQTVQHFWLPWLTVSPVYCRYTLVNSPDRIYIRDLQAEDAKSHEEEIHQIFGKLKEVLTATGSDLNHLAKATYYTTNAEVSKPFGQIRREYYDAEHPPAASLARIEAISGKGNSIAIDMIAVPTK